jgi:hypothetical protein
LKRKGKHSPTKPRPGTNQEHAAQAHENTSAWRSVLHGILFLLFVIAVKELLVSHTTTFGLLDKHLRTAAYDLSQDWIRVTRRGKIPVAVVNIGALSPCPTPENPNPRKALQQALAAVLQQEPAAVAIDIDFSPGADLSCRNAVVPYAAATVPIDCSAPAVSDLEWTDRGGPPFFQYCLATKQKIFLGVYRQQYHNRDQWLGGSEYAPLAASLLVPPEGLEREEGKKEGQQARLYMARYVQGCERLDSVSQRLALAYGHDARPTMRRFIGSIVPAWLKSRLIGNFIEGNRVVTSSASSASIFLVDFSALPKLEEEQATFSNGALTHAEDLKGKLVLLGYTDVKNPATDKFIAPGEQEQAAGVFWHACGADTLISGALLQPTPLGSLVLDLALYLPIILLVSWANVHFKEGHGEETRERVEWFATKALALLIFLCGTYFVGRLRIVWADFLIVAVIVLIHPSLEEHLTLSSRWIWGKIRPSEVSE